MEDSERTRRQDEEAAQSSAESDGELIDEFDDDDLEEEPDDVTPIFCTRCGSRYVRQSSRRNLLDILGSMIFMRTFRCHSCYRRFHSFIPPGSNVKVWHPGD